MSGVSKVLSREAARARIDAAHLRGVKVVAMSGSFDVLHDGHRAILKEARERGDELVVFLNSDDSIRRYKGSGRPKNSFDVRARTLSEVKEVDAIVRMDELTPVSLLTLLKPDIYVNGSDWNVNMVERPVVESYGGTVHVVTRGAVSTASTSELLRMSGSDESESKRAVFLDRDGVINSDVGDVDDPANIKLVEGTVEGLIALRDAGFALIIVSNQSAIGRNTVTKDGVDAVNAHIVGELKKYGVTILKVYYCPHRSDEGCACRKPGTEHLEKAADEFGIALGKCWFIGDRWSDIECGKNANMKTILIENGLYPYESVLMPDYRAKNLIEAAAIITESIS